MNEVNKCNCENTYTCYSDEDDCLITICKECGEVLEYSNKSDQTIRKSIKNSISETIEDLTKAVTMKTLFM
jgi:Fe2+ or Zn2+ uptake regulation protein